MFPIKNWLFGSTSVVASHSFLKQVTPQGLVISFRCFPKNLSGTKDSNLHLRTTPVCCFAHTQDSITPIPHVCESVKDSNFQSPSPYASGSSLLLLSTNTFGSSRHCLSSLWLVTSYYQLPTLNGWLYRFVQPLVDPMRFELTTAWMQIRCSTNWSYGPITTFWNYPLRSNSANLRFGGRSMHAYNYIFQ